MNRILAALQKPNAFSCACGGGRSLPDKLVICERSNPSWNKLTVFAYLWFQGDKLHLPFSSSHKRFGPLSKYGLIVTRSRTIVNCLIVRIMFIRRLDNINVPVASLDSSTMGACPVIVSQGYRRSKKRR